MYPTGIIMRSLPQSDVVVVEGLTDVAMFKD